MIQFVLIMRALVNADFAVGLLLLLWEAEAFAQEMGCRQGCLAFSECY